ncbi:MAG: FkbM family methyltransferase [Crocosphaera sp.]|nr:FkbM family methyltransferase [Crocosphaera sp.]
MSTRSAINLWQVAYSSPEQLGMLANDNLATLLVTEICQSNKTFIDVGAHIGSIISSVAYHDSSINIVAIEAIPEKAEKLRKKFPFVKIHGCAVSDQEGETSFFINTKQSGYSSLIKSTNSTISKSIKEIQVPIKKLDELVLSNDVDVIKIDVEGAELGVLRGSKNIIKTTRPIIMFESGPGNIDSLGFTKEALWEFLTELNYGIHIPNRVAHNDSGLSQEGFIESHIYPRRTTNYFAIPSERRLEVRDRVRKLLGI